MVNSVQQAEALGVCTTRHGRKTTDGAKNADDIRYFVEECGCCKLYVFEHQGGDLTEDENDGPVVYGGAVSFPDPKRPRKPQRKFPNRTPESQLREIFRKNKCTQCVINIATCGGTTFDHRTTRREIAESIGCQVCGSTERISFPVHETHKCGVRPCVNEIDKSDPTVNKGNTVDWQHECECPEKDLWGLTRRPDTNY